ncbi:Ctr copper transporter [Mrakia frigida]|uniref:copper transporter family protein n=1 Tax=Mrakia frigida TaxID=29902 RepID=UPI003FCC1B3E
MMKMYFHFTKGDTLLFKSWAPKLEGPFAGACVFLCVLAIIDRALHAVRAGFEMKWSFESRARASLDSDSITKQGEAPTPVAPRVLDMFRGGSPATWIQPQKITRDALRAVLQGLHSGLGLVLMLSVMTYNVWHFFSVVLGLMVGEFFFGRFAASHGMQSLSQGGHC